MTKGKLFGLVTTACMAVTFAIMGQIATTNTASADQRFTLATSQPGGAWYPMAAGLVALLNEKMTGVTWTVEKGGGSGNNKLLSMEKVECAWVSGDMLHYARDGKPPFKKKYDQTKFRAIVQLPISHSHWVVLKDSGIKSLADLKGKRVAVMKKGSSGNRRAYQILEMYGMGPDDFEAEYIGDEQAVKALIDKRIDAFIEFIAAPAPPVVNVSTTHDILLLEMESDKAKALRKAYPFMTPIDIPAGTYRGIPQKVAAFGVPGQFMCLSSVPEDVVYNMTKILMENIEKLKNVHKAFGRVMMNPEIDKITKRPLHPGALKYYKEKGVL